MGKTYKLVFLFLIFPVAVALSQEKLTVDQYIGKYHHLAVEEMKTYGIPASIKLAQGILESNSGNSPLAVEANNHFGIKCHKEWTGKTFHQDDDAENECFRKYPNPEASYRDHSLFLTTRDRYKPLFNLGPDDYKAWAYGLKQAGYATNPRYPELLIKIIEENNLDRFDDHKKRQLASNHEIPAGSVAEKEEADHVFPLAGKSLSGRLIFENNGVKFIFAREGDDLYLIASELNMYYYKIFRYNDLTAEDTISPGDKIYIEKKKSKAKESRHKLNEGETLHNVSQDYGIKLKSLKKLNGLKGDQMPSAGSNLYLK